MYSMHLMIQLLFLSLFPVALADIWGFTPDEPVGTSPNVNLRVVHWEEDAVLLADAAVLGKYYCVTGGCCPIGKICTGGVGGCSVSGTYPCQNENFCCPSGTTCYRDSNGNPRCRTGGGDPDPDPTTRTTRTTIRTTSTSTTSYATVSYETTLGVTYTYTYTVFIEGETTRTAGVVASTNPAAPTTTPPTTGFPEIVTPTVTPLVTLPPLSNATSLTSSLAPAFTAQDNELLPD
ncbi:unnamed protein product [Rhizoctonia solani]|uniref:Uncharacterized protein n=1 Tax=Rhizoctonia solani TaxID=456999 RepID=A0A8H3B151_9AGAM|nr:unnamed protein product [Rhizoctonia solani]